MKLKNILILSSVSIWLIATFVFTSISNASFFGSSPNTSSLDQGQSKLTRSSQSFTQPANPAESPARNASIPDHITYDQLFRTVRMIDEEAARLKSQGVSEKIWSEYFQREAGLTKREVDFLRQAASEFQTNILPVDKRANEIIQEIQAAYPGGRVPAGAQVPGPPAELGQLQNQRNQIALNHRDRLNNLLGARAESFTLFVQQKIAQNMRVIAGEDPNLKQRGMQKLADSHLQ